MSKYEIFIEGELMDLCCPSEKAIQEDNWHRWFNDSQTTRYLRQGMYPNSPEEQKTFLESLRTSKERLALLIKPRKLESVVGVISLSGINLINRSAELALVIGERNYEAPYKELIGMEAKCRLLEHAFEVMGLERIGGGQVADLRKWQEWQALFGYRIEGIQRKAFRKGYKVSDVFVTSVLLEDYLKIKELRQGSFWPGAKKMMELIRHLPKKTFDQKIEEFLRREWEEHYQTIKMA